MAHIKKDSRARPNTVPGAYTNSTMLPSAKTFSVPDDSDMSRHSWRGIFARREGE